MDSLQHLNMDKNFIGFSAENVAYLESLQEQTIISSSNSSTKQAVEDSYNLQDLTEYGENHMKVQQLIMAYRGRGHQKANLDPLGLISRANNEELTLAYHGLSEKQLDTLYPMIDLNIGKTKATLREILSTLERVYCSSIGAEYLHVATAKEKRWIQNYLESKLGYIKFNNEKRKEILSLLIAAEGLEKYLARRYTGVKRFGLDGGESFIPMVNEIIQRAGSIGTKEIVMGMCHRGRLNLLVNLLGKKPRDLFDAFDGKTQPKSGSGDVKYHYGFSSNVMTPGGETHLVMAFNPSHLEIVAPVSIGSVRARQVRRQDTTGDSVLSLAMHGDAAFAGQGVVQETFQMSQTRAYRTGGTLHMIVNNQVGFTTSRLEDARSTQYCTDVAKTVQAPIFHVNGNDPEAVVFIAQLAHDYRKEFHKDVVIDLYCYRRNGHNEADEPSATQPIMYSVIKSLPTTCQMYANQLIAEGLLTQAEFEKLENDYRDALDKGEYVTAGVVTNPDKSLYVDWTPYLGHILEDNWQTAVSLKKLKAYGQSMAQIPQGYELQRQVSKLIEQRFAMQTGAEPLNWGAAETLAYASLVDEGYPVRITGEDVGRGTFSHRHSELYNMKDGSMYIPLSHISESQARFDTFNSLLSEEAVLAFEYGYATSVPNGLTIWEAQFGDFANGAQVVIDQFISSGETKWQRLSGLTLLLPHGYEGQGPEHSSARLERYLQLCAEDNMQVVTPTTPAQIFHVLRRQVPRPVRKPLIVMTPKSLLRHKLAVSSLEDLAMGKFETVLPEIDSLDTAQITRLLLCGGKVYYDLLEKRREYNLNHVAIVRIEQLYPLPEQRILVEIAKYPNLNEIIWAQEEPLNQGAWYYLAPQLFRLIAPPKPATRPTKAYLLDPVARPSSAAPAAGYVKMHTEQQQKVVNDALGIVPHH